jgi:RNA polymerase sigma factor (sigma-70 family)
MGASVDLESEGLRRLLVNACYEEARRHKRWRINVRALPLEVPGDPDPMISVAERDALERAFRNLSPQHTAVFVLHHHAGLPLASIAEVVGVPLGTVKSRISRGIAQLQAIFMENTPAGHVERTTKS